MKDIAFIKPYESFREKTLALFVSSLWIISVGSIFKRHYDMIALPKPLTYIK